MSDPSSGDGAGAPIGGAASAQYSGDGIVLAIDAAPGTASVALFRARRLVAGSSVVMRGATAGDPLMRAVDDTLRTAGVRVSDLAAVACGGGPGGFTGLRIAAGLAKGLAHAADRPLLTGPSLAWAAAMRVPHAGRWLVTLDALRGEQYAAVVTVGDSLASAVGAPRTVSDYGYRGVHAADAIVRLQDETQAVGTLTVNAGIDAPPVAAGALAYPLVAVDRGGWEPDYGRLAEAQARWERDHGPLPASATPHAD